MLRATVLLTVLAAAYGCSPEAQRQIQALLEPALEPCAGDGCSEECRSLLFRAIQVTHEAKACIDAIREHEAEGEDLHDLSPEVVELLEEGSSIVRRCTPEEDAGDGDAPANGEKEVEAGAVATAPPTAPSPSAPASPSPPASPSAAPSPAEDKHNKTILALEDKVEELEQQNKELGDRSDTLEKEVQAAGTAAAEVEEDAKTAVAQGMAEKERINDATQKLGKIADRQQAKFEKDQESVLGAVAKADSRTKALEMSQEELAKASVDRAKAQTKAVEAQVDKASAILASGGEQAQASASGS